MKKRKIIYIKEGGDGRPDEYSFEKCKIDWKNKKYIFKNGKSLNWPSEKDALNYECLLKGKKCFVVSENGKGLRFVKNPNIAHITFKSTGAAYRYFDKIDEEETVRRLDSGNWWDKNKKMIIAYLGLFAFIFLGILLFEKFQIVLEASQLVLEGFNTQYCIMLDSPDITQS